MTKINKITRIKFSIFFIYFLTFFVPIYSQTVFGTQFKVSISEVNAGSFFLIFYFALIFSTFVLNFVYNKYFKYAYLITIGFMMLLLLILLFFKDGSTLRFTWYLHVVFIGVLLLAHFKEEMTLNIFDYIYRIIKKYFVKFKLILKGLIEKQKKQESNNEVEEDSK